MIAAHERALVEQIRAGGLPLVGLAPPTPQPAMVAESSSTDQVLEGLTLSYGGPDVECAEGPLVLVETARTDGSTVPHTLRYLLEVELDRVDGDAEVGEVAGGELVVAGAPRPATVQRAGSRFWAARCSYEDCTVTVVARDVDFASVRLEPVADPEPFLRARRDRLAALRASAAPPEPAPADVANPHRALVDAVLHDSVYIGRRSREDLPPRRREMRVTTGLWQAATVAQMRLADQPQHEANAAVTSIVNQLSRLQEEADWFTAQERLREGAIAETLMYGTGLREAVPSQPAQEAWRRLWDRRPHPERTLVDRRAWLDAWDRWARERLRST
jgi:hypothetical protein